MLRTQRYGAFLDDHVHAVRALADRLEGPVAPPDPPRAGGAAAQLGPARAGPRPQVRQGQLGDEVARARAPDGGRALRARAVGPDDAEDLRAAPPRLGDAPAGVGFHRRDRGGLGLWRV